MKRQVLFGLAVLGLLALAAPALATPTTISLNQVWTGNTPDGTPAWLVATFDQTGSNTGTLTLTSHLDGSDFLQGLESSNSAIGWAFFVNQAVTGISCTSGDCANSNSGFNAITITKGKPKGGFNAGSVPGGFNLAFGWDVGNRFLDGSSAIYQLTFSSPFTGSPITYNTDGWSSVAHVQGIGPNGSCSGWIVAGNGTDAQGGTACGGPPVSVPEPAELGVFGFGLLLIGTFLGLRRRYS